MSGDGIVAIVAVAASLVLAVRALRSHHVDFNRTALMAVIWVVIIAVIALVIKRFAA